MNFLYPSFLYFLGLISIPIIIHLFHFRRYKTVYFSSLQFLFNVAKETKSRNKLKHLLVLLARILAIICLVFAFSQPFIPAKNKLSSNKKETIALYIDNSFSMNAEGVNGNLLEEAKNKALEIVNTYSPSTSFILLTNDFEPRHQHILNKDQLSDYISAIHVSPRTIQFSDVLKRSRQIAELTSVENLAINLCYLSDFQKNGILPETLKPDSSVKIMLFPSASLPAKNLSIDSCWFDYPNHNINQQEKLQLKIKNYSDESYQNIPVKLYLNDSVKTLASFSIESNAEEIISLSFTNISKGMVNGKVEITDYPITYDNTYYFNYNVTQNINILDIQGENAFLNFSKFFKTDSIFKYNFVNENGINYAELYNYNVIIMNGLKSVSTGLQQELKNYLSKGGSVVFIPKAKSVPADYNSFLNAYGFNINNADSIHIKIHKINDKAPFFKNVFLNIDENPQLPFINNHLNIGVTKNNMYDELFLSQVNHPLLISTSIDKGKLYLFAFSFDEKSSNFTTHPLFIPVFYRISNLSIVNSELCYIIQPNLFISIPDNSLNKDEVIELSNTSSGESFIPEQNKQHSEINLYPGSQVVNDGIYNVISKGKIISALAMNYNRSESQSDFYSSEELVSLLSEKGYTVTLFDSNNQDTISKRISEESKGKPLWKLFIILGLVFLGFEIALVRLWK